MNIRHYIDDDESGRFFDCSAYTQTTVADLITTADIGADCYVVDDQTVAKTNGGGQRSVAGKIFDVDAQGVWVDLR